MRYQEEQTQLANRRAIPDSHDRVQGPVSAKDQSGLEEGDYDHKGIAATVCNYWRCYTIGWLGPVL